MNGFLIQVLVVVLVALFSAGLLFWSAMSIRYRISATHLQVTLFGVPVRSVRLRDIKHIGHRPVFWAERWPSTLFESRRMLVIRRRRGLFRNLVITPQYPFEFKASLEQARNAALAADESQTRPQTGATAFEAAGPKSPASSALPGSGA